MHAVHHNSFFNRINFSLLIPSLLLVGISLLTLSSIDTGLFHQQLLFLIIALCAYLLFLNIDYRVFGFFSVYIYVGMIILLALLFLVGVEAKGAIRWIDIFGLRLQFSEIIKPFFVIFLASYLSGDESRSFSKFLKSLIFVFPVFFLTLKQPDLGNAIIYLLTSIGMLFMYGFPLRYFLLLFAAMIIPFPLLFNFLKGYQKERIFSFLNLTYDPAGSSYNAIQSLISIGSGGFLGKGYGYATQSILRFLPERHTDFIFATTTESLGFIGGVIIIILYAALLYKIFKISQNVQDKFTYLVLMGFYFLLIVHVFFNIGMNIGILPIVGITLPFVSYGGSSLLTNFIILGIISSANFEFRRTKSIEIS